MRTLTLLGLVLTLSLLILATTDKASADPGISVTITAIDPIIVALNDIATYTVNVESITTEEEYVRLTVTGDPTISFDWTTKEFILPPGATESFPLEASATLGSTPGIYPFTVLGEAWPKWLTYDEAVMFGIMQTSSYTDNVILPETFVIPEYPLGTITAMAAILGATSLYIVRKRRRINTPIP